MVQKVKQKSGGLAVRFRSRTAAGYDFQIFGENYLRTYAPVTSLVLDRIFLQTALSLNMSGAKLAVQAAFLNRLVSHAI